MAFKTPTRDEEVPATPDLLFLELPRRKIPNVLPHQQEIMRAYAGEALNAADVALQLPTGSGKTLVGLLIAEWRRRKFGERAVYLCPTIQLVNQTVEQAEEKYGINAIGFVGKKKEYDIADKASYRNSDKIAVTTYSSLFNTNPYFSDPDLIVVDDAHAAENYISSMWSLRIDFKEKKHGPIQAALAGLLRPHLTKINYSRLTGNWKDSTDAVWIDKLPTPILHEIKNDLVEIVDEHAEAAGLNFEWSTIRNHLHACHFYMSSRDILIRPIIPPTWTHDAFAQAKQRLFMSATLGAGGDLERLTGRPKIHRVAIPKGWEQQGVGRRFFMFPGMSLDANQIDALRLDLMKEAGRSLVLAPSQPVCDALSQQVTAKLHFPVFTGADLEDSKKPFTKKDNAVAILANRYDGVDFPKDECRLLCVDGLPRATNSQEKFLMARMGSNALFNERVQTRVIQAIGRCTRSLEDYSAVFVTGQELEDYIADGKRRKHFHPELQAEINFGIEQSTGQKPEDFMENFAVFIENDDDWEQVNRQIVSARARIVQEPFPAMLELASVVGAEIKYQKHIWNEDFVSAMAEAESVLAKIVDPDLRGYRALWHYLAGSSAWLAAEEGVHGMSEKAILHFGRAKQAANSIPWLVGLARFQAAPQTEAEASEAELSAQIERVEEGLERLGVLHDRAFARREREILEGLEEPETFENAHKLLGELLGFSANKVETDGSPDPWWISSGKCFVFEDHAKAKPTSVLGAGKARQAAGHPKWMEQNVPEAKGLEMIPVLVSPVAAASRGAIPHLNSVCFWHLDDFRGWAQNAIATLREQRKTFVESGDLAWRAAAAAAFAAEQIGAPQLAAKLKLTMASDALALSDEEGD